jgi:hypothetical protein
VHGQTIDTPAGDCIELLLFGPRSTATSDVADTPHPANLATLKTQVLHQLDSSAAALMRRGTKARACFPQEAISAALPVSARWMGEARYGPRAGWCISSFHPSRFEHL